MKLRLEWEFPTIFVLETMDHFFSLRNMPIVFCHNFPPSKEDLIIRSQHDYKYARIHICPLRKKCPYSELFCSAFSRIGLNTERYWTEYWTRIQSKCGKIQTRITPNMNTFYAVVCKSKGSFSY